MLDISEIVIRKDFGIINFTKEAAEMYRSFGKVISVNDSGKTGKVQLSDKIQI